jgi:hypothetical protein
MQQLIWWLGNLALLVILYRGWRSAWMRRFPIFSAYLAFTLADSFTSLAIYHYAPQWYPFAYWWSQIVYLLAGLALLWEMRTAAFGAHPGASRVSGAVIGPVVAIAWVILIGIAMLAKPSGMTLAEVERAVRFTQAFLLLTFAILIRYFQVSLDRNLMGYTLGYGFFVMMSLLNLSLWKVIPAPAAAAWAAIHQLTYLISTCIWCRMLWKASVPVRPARLAELPERQQYPNLSLG